MFIDFSELVCSRWVVIQLPRCRECSNIVTDSVRRLRNLLAHHGTALSLSFKLLLLNVIPRTYRYSTPLQFHVRVGTMAVPQSHPVCTICTPVGMLGYGFNFRQIDEELSHHRHGNTPTAIILDSGSTDSGPLKLATGSMTVPRSNYTRDLAKLLKLVIGYHVPLIISSAGGDGSNAHVDELVKIVQELFAISDSNRPLKVLTIHSEIDKEFVLQRLANGKIEG